MPPTKPFQSKVPDSPLTQFNWKFLSASLALLVPLVFIALYIRDPLIRPFLGDSLAVIWLYMTLRAFIKLKTVTAASLTLALAFAVEFAQYINVLGLLGLQHIRPLRIILGSTFDPLDLAAYSLGWALIITVHTLKRRSSSITEQNGRKPLTKTISQDTKRPEKSPPRPS